MGISSSGYNYQTPETSYISKVPSYICKGISGWTNHPCKVTSQESSEKNVDNLGSKSAILLHIAVKEQRVDGS